MEKLKKVELFLGRLQPPHNGHKKIIDGMKNPIVVIVKGKKTGLDVERNPLNEDYQKKLMEMIFPNLEVSISPNGFLPGILGYFRKQGKEVTKIYAGADRIASYQDAINKANEKMPEDQRYIVTFQETERVTSATAVRNAIKTGNREEFEKLVPKAIWGEWDTLRKKIGAVSETVLTFDEWLKEEGAVSTTDNIDAKDLPLGPIVRRKKQKKGTSKCRVIDIVMKTELSTTGKKIKKKYLKELRSSIPNTPSKIASTSYV